MHPLGDTLVESGLIDSTRLEEALRLQEKSGRSLTRCLVSLGYIEEDTLLQVLSSTLNLPRYHLNGADIPADVAALLPAAIVQQYKCVPIAQENNVITLAVSDPSAAEMIEEVCFATGCGVQQVLCSEREILHAIEKHYDVTVEKILADLGPEDEAGAENGEYFIHDLQEKASEPTLINLVNLVISEAIQDGASDIHVDPFEHEMKLKYRIDGILHEIPPPPKHLQPAIVSRIKIMAGMDIAKRHIPQDGHIRINHANAQVDIRVATIPTIFGESVVMRLLNKTATQITLEELGFAPETYRRFSLLLERSFGIVLVCGPTGCGKTTTLYAALTKIYTPEKKIITIEDPVEYQLEGVNQIPVRENRGVSFASGLRSILRHDPDILMVGEIRDLETAEIAVRGALTGHLIFSTLHTNDAASAVTRLLDMGVEPFLIASSLQGVAAQRLVRRLCPHCRVPMRPGPAMLSQFGHTEEEVKGITFYAAKGCEKCKGWGYSGRVAVAELLIINEPMQRAVLERGSSQIIKQLAVGTMETIREDGWNKICQGITTFDDVMRQTQRDQVEDGVGEF